MNNRTDWIQNKVRLAWITLSVGVVLMIIGIFAELQYAYLPYNFRIVTGLGILFVGIGIGNLVRYRVALKNKESTRQLIVEERDERTVWIRARAGNRAYGISALLIFIGLMWASFAANGDLPDLAGDVLWFFLAACVVVPFIVYIASIVIDQQKL